MLFYLHDFVVSFSGSCGIRLLYVRKTGIRNLISVVSPCIAGLVSGLCAILGRSSFQSAGYDAVCRLLAASFAYFLSDTLIPLAVGILPLWFCRFHRFARKS